MSLQFSRKTANLTSTIDPQFLKNNNLDIRRYYGDTKHFNFFLRSIDLIIVNIYINNSIMNL